MRARATLLILQIGLIAGCSSILGIDGFSVGGDAGHAGDARDAAASGISQRAYLKESNTAAGDGLGTSISLSADGNTLAVGADTEATTGAVYVYTRSGTTWTQQAIVKAASGDAGDLFGHAVSLSADGNTLAVGADAEAGGSNMINGTQTDNSNPASGAAYIFARSGATWTQTTYFKANNRDSNDHFGLAVALSGDATTLVVGAPQEASGTTGINGNNNDNATGAGAAYVFVNNGAWTQQAYVKSSNTNAADQFGTSVALSTDGATLVVGAIGESSGATNVNGLQSDNSKTASGAAYAFTRAGTTWSQQAYLKASNTEAGDAFGTAVGLAGDGSTVVIGAPSEDSMTSPGDNNASDSGAAYAFTRSGTAWTALAILKETAPAANDNFGGSVGVATDGVTLIVGAHGAGGKGAADVFSRGGTITLLAHLVAMNAGANDNFGQSVAIGGTAFAVGAPGEDSNATGINGDGANEAATDSGAAYAFQ